MIDMLIAFAKRLLMLLPFLLLVRSNYKANLKKPVRYKQFLMPVVSLVLCIVAMVFLQRIYDWMLELLLALPEWLRQLQLWLADVLPAALAVIPDLVGKFTQWLEDFFKSLNLNFWAFYVANAVMLLAYVIIKRIVLLFLKGLFKDGSLFQKVACLFYEYDEQKDTYYLKPQFGQARTFLKVLYVTAALVGAVGMILSGELYLTELLTAPYYPVFSVIILGEVFFFLDGQTKKEAQEETQEGEEGNKPFNDYSIMCRVLRRLFPDKLSAENTAVADSYADAKTNEELLAKLEESDCVAHEAYGRFMRYKASQGLDLEFDYLLSGKQLLDGESVLFNNPFYYDLIPYIFYPMNRTLLRHKKVLLVLGRHGAQEDVEKWCNEGLMAVTNLPGMWSVGLLSSEAQDLDVGIITRSSVHDLQLHESNRDFFDEVEFVVLVEPSRLVTTAQVGLNSIVRHCRRKKKQLVFCSTDKNCDGLLDSLSHILMTSLQEVSATNHYKGASSYMIWEADGEHMQHRMLPNLSRYMGMGTELSFAALKNRIPQAAWYGGDAFPVEDIHWITKQYYYDLLKYAGLPTTQETMDNVFKVSAPMWSATTAPNQYLTVEDESYNMFEIKRDFSTRATEQGFVNVLCSEYMLKDYMADNDSIFTADPKAIPYITADYARTARNVVLRLCLRLSSGLIAEDEIRRELVMADCDAQAPARSLWREICALCAHLGKTETDKLGEPILRIPKGDEDMIFSAELLVLKRRFNVDTGAMDNMYTIKDDRFIRLVLGELGSAEYVAEDENGQKQYLGSELHGHIFQKYLPGQFFTFSGKYYEMLRVTSEGQVLVRRAADHINGRPFYRQIRNYFLSDLKDSTIMGECRDMGTIRLTRQSASIRVQTPAYYDMKRYNDFSTARKVTINGIPDRCYSNKSLLRIDLNPEKPMAPGTVRTLTVLINEVLRTLFAENQDYLVAVSAGEQCLPGTYSLTGEGGFAPDENSIYLIEDSQLDIGLLDAAQRNLDRIFSIICDYLQWHDETLKAEAGIETEPEGAPEDPGTPDDAPEAPAKKKGFIGRIFEPIGNFFKKIGKGIAGFFKKLFGKKKKPEEVQPETPEETPEEETVPQTEGTPETGATPDTPQTQPEQPQATAESVMMFSTDGAEPQPGDVPEGEGSVSSAAGAEDDTLDYEQEKVYKPGTGFQRLPYKERCYLRYGSDEVAKNLELAGVQELLTDLGYGNSSLTQARKGKDVAQMVERTFVPNRAGSHYCDFCGCELTGMDYEVLGDGRERCTSCGKASVKSLEEFVALHDSVLRNMQVFFGVKITAPVHVQMVNSKKLHKKLGKSFVPTGNADGRVLGVAIKDGSGYSILVENGAPKLQSVMTMVHEMTHIWQYLNWDMKAIKDTYGEDELEVYEGMSKWVEIQYAYLLGETETAKRQEIITRNRDDAYGKGFVKYMNKYPLTVGSRNGKATPFDHVKKPL